MMHPNFDLGRFLAYLFALGVAVGVAAAGACVLVIRWLW